MKKKITAFLLLAVLSATLSGSASAQHRFPFFSHKHKKAMKAKAVATSAGHYTALSWTASVTASNGNCVSPCVVGYNIYRGSSAGKEDMTAPVNSALIFGTSYEDANVTLGSTYVYVVQAVGFPGGLNSTAAPLLSALSNEAAVVFAVPLVIAPPTNVQGTPN